jgi:hypothetical protein
LVLPLLSPCPSIYLTFFPPSILFSFPPAHLSCFPLFHLLILPVPPTASLPYSIFFLLPAYRVPLFSFMSSYLSYLIPFPICLSYFTYLCPRILVLFPFSTILPSPPPPHTTCLPSIYFTFFFPSPPIHLTYFLYFLSTILSCSSVNPHLIFPIYLSFFLLYSTFGLFCVSNLQNIKFSALSSSS